MDNFPLPSGADIAFTEVYDNISMRLLASPKIYCALQGTVLHK